MLGETVSIKCLINMTKKWKLTN